LRQAGSIGTWSHPASARKNRDGFEASRLVLIDKLPTAKQLTATPGCSRRTAANYQAK